MEIRAKPDRKDDLKGVKRQFAKMLLVTGTTLAISCGNGPDSPPVCGADGGRGGMDAGSETTDGGEGGMNTECTPRTPVCNEQSNTFLSDKGMVVPIGDYRIRLTDTKEVGSEQVAVVGLLDSCNVEQSSIEVNEDSSDQFAAGSATITVGAAMITVTSPQQARLTVEIACAGSHEDGGMDAGDGG
ncbi:MAG TPA: hypothetical protein VLD37_06455 [Candidatus Bilamarchaeum sp.]|nr:hypothetical protein [Candidatus Bilamarchaeum sp.]